MGYCLKRKGSTLLQVIVVHSVHIATHFIVLSLPHVRLYTRWFKYDRNWLCVNKSQFVPVIFEPPCIYIKQCESSHRWSTSLILTCKRVHAGFCKFLSLSIRALKPKIKVHSLVYVPSKNSTLSLLKPAHIRDENVWPQVGWTAYLLTQCTCTFTLRSSVLSLHGLRAEEYMCF